MPLSPPLVVVPAGARPTAVVVLDNVLKRLCLHHGLACPAEPLAVPVGSNVALNIVCCCRSCLVVPNDVLKRPQAPLSPP